MRRPRGPLCPTSGGLSEEAHRHPEQPGAAPLPDQHRPCRRPDGQERQERHPQGRQLPGRAGDQAGRPQGEGPGHGPQGPGHADRQGPEGQGRQGPVRPARVRGRRPDLHAPRAVRRGPGQHPPGPPGPRRRARTAAQPDPRAQPQRRRQHDDLDRRLQPGALPDDPVRQGRQPLDGELVPGAVLGPLQRRRLRQRLGPGPVQRVGLRQQLLRQHRLHPRRRPVPRRPGRRLVQRDEGERQVGRRHRGDARPVRRLGPLRLRP